MYDIEITVDVVTFRDAAGTCGDQSLPETILWPNARRERYQRLLLLRRRRRMDAIWHSVEVCPVREHLCACHGRLRRADADSAMRLRPTGGWRSYGHFPGETTWKVTLDEERQLLELRGRRR